MVDAFFLFKEIKNDEKDFICIGLPYGFGGPDDGTRRDCAE